jgi:hypothetical protein
MASHNHPIQLHRTTGTIAGIVVAIAGITALRASTSWQNQKGGAGRLPLFLFCYVVSEAR